MSQFRVLVTLSIALLFAAPGMTQAGQYGSADEAKALLEKAVVAVKEDKAICSTSEKADLKTVIFMCGVQTPETAS